MMHGQKNIKKNWELNFSRITYYRVLCYKQNAGRNICIFRPSSHTWEVVEPICNKYRI